MGIVNRRVRTAFSVVSLYCRTSTHFVRWDVGRRSIASYVQASDASGPPTSHVFWSQETTREIFDTANFLL